MKKSILFLLVALLFWSCIPEEKYSVIPHIEFVSLEKISNSFGNDDKAMLTFYFEDGDGDVGLNSEGSDLLPPFDTSSIYYYNFFIDYYEKQNGTFVKVDLPAEQHARIPRLSNRTPESIHGNIEIELFINNITSVYDTIRFEFYIVDRALHHSNIITTPEIKIIK